MQRHDIGEVRGGLRRFHATALAAAAAMSPMAGSAVPPGWGLDVPIAITERSGVQLTEFQVRLVLDTASQISAGEMRSDAGDLRFGTDAYGATLLDYWIESGIGSASTVVWVRLPALPPSTMTGIHLFTGNPDATSASTLSTFDYSGAVANSAVNQLSVGDPVSYHNSQRGFHFSPLQDILLLRLGKYEPNGTVRYVTLFDYASQAILVQEQVSGPAAHYSYNDLAQPMWLTSGTGYVLELYQGAADDYYYSGHGSPPWTDLSINPLLHYHETLWCNGCTQNTFPTSVASGENFGYPDFQFMTRRQASPEPTFVIGDAARATRTVLSTDQDEAPIGTTLTLTAVVHGPFAPTGTVSFQVGTDAVPGCSAVALSNASLPAAVCTTDALGVGTHTIRAVYGGDADNHASTSNAPTQTVVRASSSTQIFTVCRTPFVERQPFTMMADIQGYSPGGGVTFSTGANVLCDSVPVQNGLAACVVDNFAVIGNGTQNLYPWTASYAGDANNTASASAPQSIVVLSTGEVVFRSDFELVPPGCPLQ